MKYFEVIPHTADIGITVYGENLASLFRHAAEGMSSLLSAHGKKPASLFERAVEVRGCDDETLLVNWLNELLYLLAVEKFLPSSFSVRTLSPGRLIAAVRGSSVADGFVPLHEIKAATYHDLSIRKTEKGYTVTIIFDV